MAAIGPFTLSHPFVNRLIFVTIAILLLSAQSATSSVACYARQFIAYREVARNSETLVKELVVKDVASCIQLCCDERTKQFGGCDSISFDRYTKNCSLFRCSALVACLPMNAKYSVNSYLFFTIPTPSSTPSSLPLASGTSVAVAATSSAATPLSEFTILSCPRDDGKESATPTGEFIREVLLHDASACLSFCCRHSRETGCESVLFRSDSFRCALYRCADEQLCPQQTTTAVISPSSDRGQSGYFTTQPSETTTSSFGALHFQDPTAIGAHDDNSSSSIGPLIDTTERVSEFLNEVGSSRAVGAAETGQPDNFHRYSTSVLTSAPASIADTTTATTILSTPAALTTTTTTTTSSDSALQPDTQSLTKEAEAEKLNEQSGDRKGSSTPTRAAQTEVVAATAAASTTTSVTASADSPIAETPPFTNDGFSFATQQITTPSPTDSADATDTEESTAADGLIARSSGSEFDQPTPLTSFDQSSSLLPLISLTTTSSSSSHASSTILPSETVDDKELPTAEREPIVTSASEATDRDTAATPRTWTDELNRATAASTAGDEQFDQGSNLPQSSHQLETTRTESIPDATVEPNTRSTSAANSIINHSTLTTIGAEETSPTFNNIVFGTRSFEDILLSTDAAQSQGATRTDGVSEPQGQGRTVAGPLINLIGTTSEATQSNANDNDRPPQSQSSTVRTDDYDHTTHSKIDVSMASNGHLAATRFPPIWMLSVVLAIFIALLTVVLLIVLHNLGRLTHRSGEYNLLKALSSRKFW